MEGFFVPELSKQTSKTSVKWKNTLFISSTASIRIDITLVLAQIFMPGLTGIMQAQLPQLKLEDHGN